jgi:hypothetical protein
MPEAAVKRGWPTSKVAIFASLDGLQSDTPREPLLSDGFILEYQKATRPEASHEHLRYPNESTEYRAARNALLNEEIALRAHIETVAAKRRLLLFAHRRPRYIRIPP